jgi:hypothetical protein
MAPSNRERLGLRHANCRPGLPGFLVKLNAKMKK